jgi:two-component system, NarL family, nitrate/nitrite response regulator NarL
VRLVIFDGQRILAEALAAALDARGYEVLAVAMTATECLDAIDIGRPDACLLGLQSSDRASGLKAAGIIRQRYPDTRVLILSELSDPDILSQAVDSGVAGFIGKDQSVDQIAATLDLLAAGGNSPDSGLLRMPPRGPVKPKNPGHEMSSREKLLELSPREKEIVARIVEGQSTRQMSFAMNITVSTVRTYVKNVLAKFGAHSRLQLAVLASHDSLAIDLARVDHTLALTGESIVWPYRRSLVRDPVR